MSKVYSFKVTDEKLIKKIDGYCDGKMQSKASILKKAIDTYIDQQVALEELPTKAKETIDMLKKMEKLMQEYKEEHDSEN